MEVYKECKNCLNYLVCEFLDTGKEGEDYGYID